MFCYLVIQVYICLAADYILFILDHSINFVYLESKDKFPLSLRRCLLGYREGLELFRFFLTQLTSVIRQKGYIYSLGGNKTGTSLEVRIKVIFPFFLKVFVLIYTR